MSMKKSVPEIVRLVMGAVIAPDEVTAAVAIPVLGQLPSRCRFCGDPTTVGVQYKGERVRVTVEHDVPVCPEFLQYCENVE